MWYFITQAIAIIAAGIIALLITRYFHVKEKRNQVYFKLQELTIKLMEINGKDNWIMISKEYIGTIKVYNNTYLKLDLNPNIATVRGLLDDSHYGKTTPGLIESYRNLQNLINGEFIDKFRKN